jgi:endogenous inhibitor of DNA gyrase (YacG/DUF329 family)
VYLDKPYPLKPVCFMYPNLASGYFYTRRCPICKRIVNWGNYYLPGFDPERMSNPFRDNKSREEYTISGLCQDCQDKIWHKEKSEVEE